MTKPMLTADDILMGKHVRREMLAERITVADILAVLNHGDVIEDYAADVRGASYLALGFPGGRAVHVCATRAQPVFIITTYLPSLDKFEADYKTRRKP